MPAPLPQALVFDVFGTVVDWRGSIAAEGARLAREWRLAPSIDWAAFADAWRGRYRPSMERVARGELPWTNLDGLHRLSLEDTLAEFGLTGLAEEQLAHLTCGVRELHPPRFASTEGARTVCNGVAARHLWTGRSLRRAADGVLAPYTHRTIHDLFTIVR